MSKNVTFTRVGDAYTGISPKNKSYIQLNLRNDLASRISYGDLTEKIFLFKDERGAGQFAVFAPVQKVEEE